MSSTTDNNGRLGNQIFRNIACSILARKFDLKVCYSNYPLIKNLGIKLYSGNNIYSNTIEITDDNYQDFYNMDDLKYNINLDKNYFQTSFCSNLIFNYIQNNMINIISKNNWSYRYKNNNDIAVHIRLGDIAYNEHYDVSPLYYISTIMKIDEYDNVYIGTDSPDHETINIIKNALPRVIILNFNEIHTLQFLSTCKNVILSHGSFSAILGYLSFFSKVYFPMHDVSKKWYNPEMFDIQKFNEVLF